MINVLKRVSSADLLAIQANTLADRSDGTFDIYFNEGRCCSSNSASVRHYRLVAYQILQKGGSYRDRYTLRRSLRPERLQHGTDIARRSNATGPSTFFLPAQQHSQFRQEKNDLR